MNQQHDPPLNLFKYAMIPFYLLFHFVGIKFNIL